ncbi:hypothetical protein NBRC3293_2345 [Gluconobacter oxydans NBRC 3293]|uniref:Uncharacterized protein n=1 Tax=Gluconobacter oxydans NBRC 3293 TaxID=1315969 RepID=A0A829WM01_GLUOY|nr:hypothetical protein NBRC3293_2345 [Gluconobacter oxydans NBRC 3293]
MRADVPPAIPGSRDQRDALALLGRCSPEQRNGVQLTPFTI